jgi:DNA-binding XRE family transcriptional regulator
MKKEETFDMNRQDSTNNDTISSNFDTDFTDPSTQSSNQNKNIVPNIEKKWYNVENDRNMTKYINNLAMLRKKNGLTQAKLAKLVDMPKRTLLAYEHGERDLAKCGVLAAIRLSEALNCEVKDLLGRD